MQEHELTLDENEGVASGAEGLCDNTPMMMNDYGIAWQWTPRD